MSGFYLILGQGITTFKEIYGRDKYKNISKVAEFFRNLIDDDKFSKSDIDLKGINELAKGYEKGVIISKYYAKDNYFEDELINDLIEFKNIYDDISEALNGSSYMEIVSNVIQNIDSNSIIINEASNIIEKTLFGESSKKEIEGSLLKEVKIPESKKLNKYSAITKKNIKKVDYLKKTKSNIKNGILGEELVMRYEKDRLCKLGREDLAANIEWVSTINDEIGYDIISFDVDEYYNVKEKYIEVKTTEGNDNSIFYISKNEINTMERFKEKYFIYRVFNLNTKNPLMYILNYDDFKNKIKLEVDSYMAVIK